MAAGRAAVVELRIDRGADHHPRDPGAASAAPERAPEPAAHRLPTPCSPLIASAWALLLGIALIMLGNGLQNTLLGVRATLEGFGTGTTGTGDDRLLRRLSRRIHRRTAPARQCRAHPRLRSPRLARVGRHPAAHGLRDADLLVRLSRRHGILLRRPLRGRRELDQRRGDEQDPRPDAVGVHDHGAGRHGQRAASHEPVGPAQLRAVRAGLRPDLLRPGPDHPERGTRAGVGRRRNPSAFGHCSGRLRWAWPAPS